jgi:hypothetical protein
VVHFVDRFDRRDVAEVYPDFLSWDGGIVSTETPPSNANSLHDVALICLAEPVMTMLPTLDTSTHVYPYNTADAAGGRRTNVIAVGR